MTATRADDGVRAQRPDRRLIAAAAGALSVLIALALALAMILPPVEDLRPAMIPAAATSWSTPGPDALPIRPQVGETAGRIDQLPWSRPTLQITGLIPSRPGPGPYILLLPAAAGEPSVFVNGAEVPSALAGGRYLALSDFRPITAAIPEYYFRPGPNRVDVILDGARGRVLAAPMVLDSETEIAPAMARLTTWLRLSNTFAAPLTLLAALLALCAMISPASRSWYLALAAAAAAAGCRAALGGATLSEDWEAWRLAVNRLLLVSALLSLTCAWLNRPRLALPVGGVMGLCAWAAVGVVSALIAVTIVGGLWPAFEPFLGLWFLRLEVTYGLGLALLSVTLAAAAAITIGRTLVRLAVTNLDLSRLVHRQRVEIEATAQALNHEMRRSAILEERQRLARDMHDGLGGSLTSLIARVRTRRIDIDQIESELRGGLADLRLVVDSLDAVGESLSSALAMFKLRIEPQAEAAGLTLTWDQPEDLGEQAEDPRWTLHLYRLLQEAVTNAARHSQGQRLSVTIRRVGARGLRIEVADDGIGFKPNSESAGKGLANMTFRAARLGAALRISPIADAPGTRLVLDIPDTRPDWADD